MSIYDNIIAVTDRHLCARPLPEQAERICRLHPQGIILREKDLPEREYEMLARAVISSCAGYGVPLTLHYYPETALKLGVKRIHLPLHELEDLDRTVLDQFEVIGTSVHSAADALRAQSLGASYLTAGHIFATDCKKGLPARGLDFLAGVCRTVSIPVYAIGGIGRDEDRIKAVMECGAAGACVMSGMMEEIIF